MDEMSDETAETRVKLRKNAIAMQATPEHCAAQTAPLRRRFGRCSDRVHDQQIVYSET
jgi:hypothetical protein